MDLISIFWLLVAACALIFAGDTLVVGILRQSQMPRTRKRPTRFGVLMFLFALACIVVAIIDPTAITVSRSSLH